MLLITDTEDALKNIARVLRRLDCETPQVRIKVRIVEITATSNLEYGFEYTQDRSGRSSLLKAIDTKLNPKNYNDSLKPGATPFQGATFTLFTSGKHSGEIDVLIRALHEATNAEILSCPDLLVSKGGTASLHTGQEVPYQEVKVIGTQTQYFTQFKKVGVELNVRPILIGEDAVKLYVKPQVSSLTGWTDPALVGGISNPIISSRNCETTVSVEDGQTLVIAGLLENRRLLIKRSVPIIGDIPLLGYLFSSTRHEIDKAQLLFFLTIETVHPGRPENLPRVFRPDDDSKDK
jgi:type IV pilus assembly protein PilQ